MLIWNLNKLLDVMLTLAIDATSSWSKLMLGLPQKPLTKDSPKLLCVYILNPIETPKSNIKYSVKAYLFPKTSALIKNYPPVKKQRSQQQRFRKT